MQKNIFPKRVSFSLCGWFVGMKHARIVWAKKIVSFSQVCELSMCVYVCISNNSQFYSTISFPFPIKIDIIFTIFPHLNISIGFDCEKCRFLSIFLDTWKLRRSIKLRLSSKTSFKIRVCVFFFHSFFAALQMLENFRKLHDIKSFAVMSFPSKMASSPAQQIYCKFSQWLSFLY